MVENHTEVTSECWRQTLISFHFLNPSRYFFCILKHNAIAGQVNEEIVSNNPFFRKKNCEIISKNNRDIFYNADQ